jgi:hypothetical protein
VSVWDDASDPQMQGLSHSVKAGVAALEGDFALALEHAMQVRSTEGVLMATASALALRDTEVLDQVADFTKQQLRVGGRMQLLTDLLRDAGRRALEGDFDGAAGAFTEAIELGHRIVSPAWVVSIQALASGLLGPDHPVGLDAGRAARQWLRDHGMRGWERTLSEFLPPEDSAASETA